jgi:DNA-binding transcriptional MerR regulator
MEIMRRYLLAMNINDVEKILPEEDGQPDPAEQMQMQQMQAELEELSAKIEKLQSETALNYAKIESEYSGRVKTEAGIYNDDRKLDISEAQVLNQIQLGRSQQSVGKAPAGVTESTAKREYGLRSNNQGE